MALRRLREAGIVERAEERRSLQDLRQQLPLWHARPIYDVERNAKATEILNVGEDSGVIPAPVGSHAHDIVLSEPSAHGSRVQNRQLIDLAGETPACRYVDEHSLAAGDQRADCIWIERLPFGGWSAAVCCSGRCKRGHCNGTARKERSRRA